jgi:glycerophosphoryl diester phosphodiesterase
MSVHTSRVTRPRTGFPFLDAGLDQPGAVLAFAHRGGAHHPEITGLENTLAAFEHAVELGYQYLETDVHTTADGVLLAVHDAVLDRVTDSSGRIAEMRYADLSAALIGDQEPIPTLEELFERFPQARFNIDLKSESAAAPLAALLRRFGLLDRVCVGSFHESRLRAFRRLVGPSVATSIGPVGILGTMLVPVRRLADALRGKGAALQVPRTRGPLTVVTERFVARAHANGIPVHAWTIDEPAEMHALLDMGVDGLMTDRTDVLRKVLLERGQWMGAGG